MRSQNLLAIIIFVTQTLCTRRGGGSGLFTLGLWQHAWGQGFFAVCLTACIDVLDLCKL